MKFKQKKSVAALLAILVVAIAAIGAYAYWTTSGDGTGTADTGTTSAFVVTQLGAGRSTSSRAAPPRTSRSTSRTPSPSIST